jgi:cytochrome c-type biogenesis protein
MQAGRVALVVVVVAVVAVAAYAAVVGLHLSLGTNSGTMAPDFTLTDINGQNFTLSHYRGNSVVVIDFTSVTCSECQVVEQTLKSLWSNYNATGKSPVQIVSVYTSPQFGDTVPAIKAFQAKNGITWVLTRDTMQDSIQHAYGVTADPTVVVVDKQGHTVYNTYGSTITQNLPSSVSQALAGTAAPVEIVTFSVFALAAIAGVTTFFSPCAFPMFPGYMSLFLGLNTGRASASADGKDAYKGAARRALSAGGVAALGMLVVFLAIGLALIYAASTVSGYIPDFMPIVGVVLIVLGALLLTNLQYWRIVAPFQALWRRIRGASSDPAAAAPVGPAGEDGFYLKLFGYGMGYAAAAAGCVAPVILSAIVAGMVLSTVDGVLNILIYSLTAALLMVVVTLIIALAGQRYVNVLKAYTPLIKKVSAVVLVVVGIYLVYFYYTAWIA